MTDQENRTLTDKFMLRLPDGMRGRVKRAAAENNRSMNAEIVATLEEKYPEQYMGADELLKLLASLATNKSETTSASNATQLNHLFNYMGVDLVARFERDAVILQRKEGSEPPSS